MPPSSPSSTSTTQTSEPWKGAAKYLTNDNSTYNPATGMFDNNGQGMSGLYEQVANFANQYQNLTPNENTVNNMYSNAISQRNDVNDSLQNEIYNAARRTAYGEFNTNLGPIANAQANTANLNTANTSLANANTANTATSDTALSNLNAARAGQGVLNPTNSLSQLLSGHIDNPYLSSMNQANINQAMQGYNDAIQNVNQQVMPGIAEDAFASGQYGGSRQGVAQGLALQQLGRNARDLGQHAMDSGNMLYGNAYQNAQNMMYNTANNLNNQAGQNAQYNASNQQQNNQFNASQSNAMNQFNTGQLNDISKYNAGQSNAMNQFNASQGNAMNQFNAGQLNNMNQFNANLGLQNNNQQMQQKQNNLANLQAGVKMGDQAANDLWSGQDQNYTAAQKINQQPMLRQQDMLNALAGVIMPGASLGGTTTSSQPYHSSTAGNILGGLSSLGGLLSMFG